MAPQPDTLLYWGGLIYYLLLGKLLYNCIVFSFQKSLYLHCSLGMSLVTAVGLVSFLVTEPSWALLKMAF